MATNTTIQIVKTAAEYIITFLRPTLSIVKTNGIVPAANNVFMTTARS